MRIICVSSDGCASDLPLRHGGQAGAVVREAARSQPDTSRVAHMDLMILRAPIDTREPALLMFHAQLLSCHGPCHGPSAMLCLSLYLALDGANSPPGVHCGNSPRHGSGSGAHKRWIHWLLSASWPARTLPACEPQNRYRDLWMGQAPGGAIGPGSRSLTLACPG